MSDYLPGFEPPSITVEEGIEQAEDIVRRAIAEHQPSRVFVLFSGGNDPLVLLDVMRRLGLAHEVAHVNTGIGIPDTTAFALRQMEASGLAASEWTPPVSYGEMVLDAWDGMPGPGLHTNTFINLKQRCVEAMLRHHRKHRYSRERFLLLTGARRAESRRRMGTSEPERRKGGQVWLNPLINWSNENMADYRHGESLPVSEVSANLHMSGECLCGAFASQNDKREERAMLEFFYRPWVEENIAPLEKECRTRGLPYCEWGVKRPGKDKVGLMCSGCTPPLPFDETPVDIVAGSEPEEGTP